MRYEHIPAYGDFFTIRNIQLLAWEGASPVADHCFGLLSSQGLLTAEATLRELTEAVFLALKRWCRVEYLFKTVALQRMFYGKHSPKTTAFFFEFPLGEARADLVIVNGLGTVVEVKTARDHLTRLDTQLAEYSRVFGHVAVFAEGEDVSNVVAAVPEHVGIASLTERNFMSWHRRTRETFAGLRHTELFRVLRQGEIPTALAHLQRVVPDVHPADWRDCCFDEFRRAPIEECCRVVHDALRRRSDTLKRHAACVGFPNSLWALGYGAQVPPKDWRLVRSRLDRPYGEPL